MEMSGMASSSKVGATAENTSNSEDVATLLSDFSHTTNVLIDQIARRRVDEELITRATTLLNSHSSTAVTQQARDALKFFLEKAQLVNGSGDNGIPSEEPALFDYGAASDEQKPGEVESSSRDGNSEIQPGVNLSEALDFMIRRLMNGTGVDEPRVPEEALEAPVVKDEEQQEAEETVAPPEGPPAKKRRRPSKAPKRLDDGDPNFVPAEGGSSAVETQWSESFLIRSGAPLDFPLTCIYCREKKRTYASMHNHQRTIHKEDREHIYGCSGCSNNEENPMWWKCLASCLKHLLIHCPDKKFIQRTIEEAQKARERSGEINQRNTMGPPSKISLLFDMPSKIKCPYCDVVHKMSRLDIHLRKDHQPNELLAIFGCRPCDKWYTGLYSAENHVKYNKDCQKLTIRSKEEAAPDTRNLPDTPGKIALRFGALLNKMVCPYCEKIIRASRMDFHIRTDHKYEQRLPVFGCGICNAWYLSPGSASKLHTTCDNFLSIRTREDALENKRVIKRPPRGPRKVKNTVDAENAAEATNELLAQLIAGATATPKARSAAIKKEEEGEAPAVPSHTVQKMLVQTKKETESDVSDGEEGPSQTLQPGNGDVVMTDIDSDSE